MRITKPSHLLVLGLALIALNTSAAPVPTSEKDIPIFKGAVRDESAEEERKQEQEGTSATPESLAAGQQSQLFRLYRTSSVVDDVFEFYRNAFNAQEGFDEADPMTLKPGQSTKIMYSLYPHADTEFEDVIDAESKAMTYPGHAMKAAFEKDKRKYFRDGEYLAEAQFSWSTRNAAGELANFIVTVLDDSIREQEDGKTGKVSVIYQRNTQIHFLRENYMSPR